MEDIELLKELVEVLLEMVSELMNNKKENSFSHTVFLCLCNKSLKINATRHV
ncbi:MAG: hypothetical protein LZ173_02015 [Thaumarchaeota archaeon]|jgi:hypothetical protein|nr:hypothetical protein [Candidatus Geocrenenecus arthurdayi]